MRSKTLIMFLVIFCKKIIIMNPRKNNITNNFFSFFDRYPREYFVIAFFAIFYFAIIWETFSYTVVNHKFYDDLAYRQQVGEIEIPVTRGSIYSMPSDWSKEGTVFSTSVDLNDIAIDPQIEWDKLKLESFLTDMLYNEMCYIKTSTECYNELLRFLRVLEIPEYQFTEVFIKDIISENVEARISKDKITSVKLRESISPDDEKTILSWWIEWVYPSENGLYINPEELLNPQEFWDKYVALYGWDVEQIIYAVRPRDLRYIPIYQKLSIASSDEIEQYISDENQALWQWIIDKQESIGWFIILTPHAQRIYPESLIWAQILWFLDNGGVWRYGLEWYFNDILRWNPWELVAKKDVKWRRIDPVSFWTDNISALEWVDIETTIDRNVQRRVELILEEWVKKYQANKWSIVVLEPKTGRILSMANYPSYDPNNPWEVYELKKVNYVEYPNPETDLLWKTVFVEDIERGDKYIYDGKIVYLREALREEYADYEKTKYTYKNEFGAGVYQNETISSLYEPGSIMKTITVAGWIDSGEINRYDFYQDDGKVTIDNFTIRNVDDDCLWYNTFQNAFNYSCNVWMIRIVQKMWKALLHKYFTEFWFWEKTEITLDWEVTTKIEPYEKWSTAKLLTSSYWLWVSVTPLQIASAYATIANWWVYMKPYLVDSIKYSDGKQVNFSPQAVRRVLKEDTADIVTDMLVASVDDWVAGNGRVEWYSIAGKTGTSQIAYKWSYEDWIASTNGSFAWYAPAEDPRFVILVKLERPRTSPYWGATSAYMFWELAKELLEYYWVPKKLQNETWE